MIREIVKERLIAAQSHGVGFDEIREIAERRGLLTGKESGVFLSFGSAMMRAEGGVVVRYRASRHKSAKGRRVAVYVHATFDPTPIE